MKDSLELLAEVETAFEERAFGIFHDAMDACHSAAGIKVDEGLIPDNVLDFPQPDDS